MIVFQGLPKIIIMTLRYNKSVYNRY